MRVTEKPMVTYGMNIITSLQAKATRDHTRKLSARAIDKDPACPSTYHIEQIFVTVEDAIRVAHLYPTRPNLDDLIRSLREFYDTHHRVPTCADADAKLLPYGKDVYAKAFGSWNKALEAAGFATVSPTGGRNRVCYNHEAVVQLLVEEARALYGEVGVLPTTAEHDRRRPSHSSRFILRYVECWEKFAELAGLTLTPKSIRGIEWSHAVHARTTAELDLPPLANKEAAC